MIEIEHINLHLPPGYEGRTSAVVNEFAAALAVLIPLESINIESLSIPVVTVDSSASDHDIGRALAQAVLRGIETMRR
jgi:hypothetical protein